MSGRSNTVTSRRARRRGDSTLPKVPASAIIREIEAESETTMRLTFTERIFTSTMPLFTAGDGETVESMTKLGETEVELVFTGPVDGTTMMVKDGDAGLRTGTGGFVPAGSYDLPEFQQAA